MNQERLLQRFIRYITCDSESRDELMFCQMIEEELELLGVAPQRQEVGSLCDSNGFNIYCMLPGTGEPLLFSCHLDTVTPGKNITPQIENGVIQSDGSTILGSDDKAGIAAVMEALTCYVEGAKENRPVEILFTICEEVGLLGAKNADYSGIASKQAVVLDTSDLGKIVNRSPAHIQLHVEIEGRSAHAGVSPELGIHALKAATQAVTNIPCGYVGDMSVMNVANFLAPGKPNIVPDHASFDAEIRSHSEDELARLTAELEQHVADACRSFGATYTISKTQLSNCLYVPEDSALIGSVNKAMEQAGVTASIEKTFGGCDATWLSENGIAAVNLGVGMQDAHSCSEHIAVHDLVTITRIVEHLMAAE